MGRWLIALLLTGCTFVPRALQGGGEDLATPPADLSEVDLLEADLSTGPDMLPPPFLQVSRSAPGSTSSNLTSEGTLDWAHWGLTTATSVNRKTGGTSAITAAGNTSLHQYSSYTAGFTWADGAPTSSTADTHTGIYVNGPGHGFAIKLPASPVQHTAYLYLNSYNAVCNFSALLADGSALPFTEMVTAGGNLDLRYTVTWRAATDTTLQIDWTIMTDNGSGSADLLAITLQ